MPDADDAKLGHEYGYSKGVPREPLAAPIPEADVMEAWDWIPRLQRQGNVRAARLLERFVKHYCETHGMSARQLLAEMLTLAVKKGE